MLTHNGADGANNVIVNGTNLYPTKQINSMRDVTDVFVMLGVLTKRYNPNFKMKRSIPTNAKVDDSL